MTTQGGLEFAARILEEAPEGTAVLWSSMPCTAGCPWYHVNKRHASARLKHEEQVTTFHKLAANFQKLSDICRVRRHIVCHEWPKDCALWPDSVIQGVISDLALHPVDVKGCRVGLRSASGIFMAKTWRVVTNCPELWFKLKPFRNMHVLLGV